MVLKWVLLYYEKWPGLKINYHKSSLVFLGDISFNNYLISLVFNCSVQKLPITYQGLPFASCRLKKQRWRLLTDRIQKRLVGWKRKMPSFRGQITMINTILSAMPIYFLSFSHCLDVWKRRTTPCEESFFRAVLKKRKDFLPRELEKCV